MATALSQEAHSLRQVDNLWLNISDNSNPARQQKALRDLARVVEDNNHLPFYPDQGVTVETIHMHAMRNMLSRAGALDSDHPQDPSVRAEAYKAFTAMAQKWPTLTGDPDLWWPLCSVAFSADRASFPSPVGAVGTH